MNKPLDLTKPIQTRGGLKARILSMNLQHASNRNVVVAITHSLYDGETIYLFGNDGKFSNIQHDLDLVNVPEKFEREIWINFYDDDNFSPSLHASADHASFYQGYNWLATKRVIVNFTRGDTI